MGPEHAVLGALATMAQSGLGEVFGRGFHSWAGKEGTRLGAKFPKWQTGSLVSSLGPDS